MNDINSRDKQRFSRTAFGFPIRIDAKRYLQGVSSYFPTWARAHWACTYVRRLLSDGYLAAVSLTNCLPVHYHCATIDVVSSCVRCVCTCCYPGDAVLMGEWSLYQPILVHLRLACGSLGSHLQRHDTMAVLSDYTVQVSLRFDCDYLIVLLYNFKLHF